MNRARIKALTPKIYEKEITNLKEKFFKNGYPIKLVNDVIDRSINLNKDCTKKKLSSSDFKNIVKIPYIGKASNEYKKKLEKLLINYIEDFKVIFTTTKVSNYFSNKDKTPHELKSNVVYEYKCSYDESIQYIGVKEHLKGKTAVSDHISNCNICKKEKLTVNNFGILKE